MRAFILLAAALAVAACAGPETQSGTLAAQTASAAAASGHDCFNVSFVTDYDNEAANTIELQVGPSAAYDLRVSGAQCNALDWTQRLTLESTPSSWICVGNQAGQGNVRFLDLTTGRRVSCYIDSVTRVAPSQAHG